MPLQQSTLENRLLRLLQPEDFAELAPHLEPIDLPKGFQIAKPNQPISHHFFMEAGIGSIVGISPEGLRAEVGLVGRDGIVPTAAVLASDTSICEIIVQVGGRGHRIESAAFKEILAGNAGIRGLALRFVQSLTAQTAQTALSNAVHRVEERLARWLLMCHDRIGGDQMALTHEYIAVMLAVRRPSVTTALHILEGNHLIYASRGLITIRNRQALEAFAADAYGIPEAEYRRLLGPL